MHITINQQSVAVTTTDTLHSILISYCASHRLDLDEVAVARHDTLLPRSLWPDYRPQAGDTFTLFAAVAGG